MQFDGVMCEDVALKVKRPKDYIGIDPSLGSYIPGTSNGADSPNKLFIGGLPTYLNDEQVLELLKAFGELRSFNLVKETQGGVQVSKVGILTSRKAANTDDEPGLRLLRVSRPLHYGYGYCGLAQFPAWRSILGCPASCRRQKHWYTLLCHPRVFGIPRFGR
jgi:hypothetical protein